MNLKSLHVRILIRVAERHHANHAAESHSTPFGQRQVRTRRRPIHRFYPTPTSPTNSGNGGE